MLGGITWELGETKGLHPLSQAIWTLVVFLVVLLIGWSVYDYRQRVQPPYVDPGDTKMAMIDRVHHGHWPIYLALFMIINVIVLYILVDQKRLSELSQLLYIWIVVLAFVVIAWAVYDSRSKDQPSKSYVSIDQIDSYSMSVNARGPEDDDEEFRRQTAAKAKQYAQERIKDEKIAAERKALVDGERRRAEEAELRAKEEFARRQKQEADRRTREEAQKKAREEIAARKARLESEGKVEPKTDGASTPFD
jgi:hypothetical protein